MNQKVTFALIPGARTVERGVGGVGGPGPAEIAFYEQIEHNFEIDYFVFFHYSQNHYTVSVSVKI